MLKSEVFYLYAVSYYWYTVIGVLISCTVGVIASYFFGFNDPKSIDKDLLTPLVHRFFPQCEKMVNVCETLALEKFHSY